MKETSGDDVSIVYHDNYYKAHNDMTYEERAALNYDHPEAFDTGRMVEDLKRLLAGDTVQCPVYDYSIHNRSAETVEIRPTKVVIVEGDFDLRGPRPAGADGHQNLCGYRRGCAHPAADRERCQGAGAALLTR